MGKDSKKQIYKPKPVSGFPEWLPEVRLVEQQWFDHIRRVFESYGFCSIETPSVEEIDVLTAKGEVDKEIYVIERLHKEDGDKDARLALHFDQTVPLARYVAQHFNDLTFPFKRYQMQRVWRGERPQAGRFREFYQCDIDVINVDNLPLHFDAEMPAIIWEILNGLPGMENETIQIRVSNRKILIGLCETLGIKNTTEVTRIIDKMEKIGSDAVAQQLADIGIDEAVWKILHDLANIKSSPSDISGLLRDFIARNDVIAGSPPYPPASGGEDSAKAETGEESLLQEGISELEQVMESLKHLPEDAVIADLSIVRGLDYYTGTVYETVFTDDPDYGSICSGGRYDDLASGYINKHLPGVGISIGFSRLFAKLLEKGTLDTSRKSTADILMVLFSEEQRAATAAKAQELRAQGFNVEMYHTPRNPKKQFEYANKKGIPFVYLISEDGPDEIKNMLKGEQKEADAALADMKEFKNASA